MANYVVGLTGGIGSGKTAASDYLSSLGVAVVDADVVARDVVEPGSVCLEAISEHFGQTVLNHDGSLDRRALRGIVFNNNKQKQWLNDLLHPAIRERLLNQLAQANSPYAVLVAPLLLENKLDRYCQRVLVIDVPEATQLTRTIKRDNSDQQQVQAIIAAQLSRQDRLTRADDIINNDSDIQHLQKQLDNLDSQYRQFAASYSSP